VEARAGHVEEARAAYAALAQGGGPVSLYLEYGQLLGEAHRWEELLAEVETALDAHPDEAALLNLKGVALTGLHRGQEAEGVFRAALEAEPGHGAAATNLVRLLVEDGKEGEGIAILRAVLAANPRAASARRMLADLLLRGGKAEEAIGLYEEAVKGEAGARDLARLTLLYLRAGRKDAAIRTARRLATARAKLPAAHLLLVQTLAAAGRMKEALVEAQALEQAAPDWPPGLNQEAALLAQARRFDDAIAVWRRSLAARPDQVAVEVDLARVLLMAHRGDEAAASARKVVAARPKEAVGHLLLGRALEMEGDREGARRAFERARELAAGTPSVLTEIAEYYLRAGDTAAAERLYEAVLQKDPRHAGALLRLAMVAEHQGRYEEAARRYRRLLKVRPEEVVGLNNLAWILADELGAPEEAVTRAAEANRLKPNQWWLLDTWAWALGKAGKVDPALRKIEQALAQRPDNPTLHYHRAVLLEARGDRVGAVVAAKRALEITPEFPEAKETHALLARLQR